MACRSGVIGIAPQGIVVADTMGAVADGVARGLGNPGLKMIDHGIADARRHVGDHFIGDDRKAVVRGGDHGLLSLWSRVFDFTGSGSGLFAQDLAVDLADRRLGQLLYKGDSARIFMLA